MKRLTIFTLIALFALSSLAGTASNIVWSSGRVADSLETFMSTAFDGDGNIQNDEGHLRAAEAMFANFDRRFLEVLATDMSSMSAEEQMDFFAAFGDLLSTMGRINAYAKAFNDAGHLEVPLLEDYEILVGSAKAVWSATKIDNELVVVPDWDGTFVEAQRTTSIPPQVLHVDSDPVIY